MARVWLVDHSTRITGEIAREPVGTSCGPGSEAEKLRFRVRKEQGPLVGGPWVESEFGGCAAGVGSYLRAAEYSLFIWVTMSAVMSSEGSTYIIRFEEMARVIASGSLLGISSFSSVTSTIA